MSSTRSIAVKLPHIRLPDADWADCFEIDIDNRHLTAIEAAHPGGSLDKPAAIRLR